MEGDSFSTGDVVSRTHSRPGGASRGRWRVARAARPWFSERIVHSWLQEHDFEVTRRRGDRRPCRGPSPHCRMPGAGLLALQSIDLFRMRAHVSRRPHALADLNRMSDLDLEDPDSGINPASTKTACPHCARISRWSGAVRSVSPKPRIRLTHRRRHLECARAALIGRRFCFSGCCAFIWPCAFNRGQRP